MLFMIPRIHTDSKKLAYFGMKFKEVLTLKHRETHGCVVSTAATDALVLKHQVISTLSAD